MCIANISMYEDIHSVGKKALISRIQSLVNAEALYCMAPNFCGRNISHETLFLKN